jgi:hypothetical protein
MPDPAAVTIHRLRWIELSETVSPPSTNLFTQIKKNARQGFKTSQFAGIDTPAKIIVARCSFLR